MIALCPNPYRDAGLTRTGECRALLAAAGYGIDPAVLPSSNRNAFFVARRSFYLALDGCKHEI